MTITEAARYYGLSRSTIYRQIRQGRLKARKVGRRWQLDDPRVREKQMTEWHQQVNRRAAEKAGLEPQDFTWLNYPCSDVEIGLLDSRYQPIVYRCRVPADTPQVNQYVEDKSDPTGYRALPDPRGSALSRIDFELRDADTGDVLDDSSVPDHQNGDVQGGPNSRAKLWQVLTPGTSIRVTLSVCGMFFPYNDPDKRDGGNHYSEVNQGYLNTPTIRTGVHTLSMDQDGNVSLDGKSR